MMNQYRASAFHFTADDLNANRNGSLSQTQRQNLRRELRLTVRGGILFLCLLFLAAPLYLALFYAFSAKTKSFTSNGVLGAAILFGVTVVVFGRMIFGITFAPWKRTRADLHAGKINEISGQISISPIGRKTSSLIVRGIDSRLSNNETVLLHFIIPNSLALHDGAYYRIFYLPNTLTVLSSEPCIAKIQPGSSWIDPQLMDALGFTFDDLRANRSGAMSAEQQRRLPRTCVQYEQWSNVLISLVSAFLALVIVLIGYASDFVWIMLVLTILLTTYCVYFLVVQWRRVQKDLRTGRVNTISGSVLGRFYRQDCYLKVEGTRFDVSKRVFRAFYRGEAYRLYYAPGSKTILSAEPIDQPRIDVALKDRTLVI